jgi:hypothetical protein
MANVHEQFKRCLMRLTNIHRHQLFLHFSRSHMYQSINKTRTQHRYIRTVFKRYARRIRTRVSFEKCSFSFEWNQWIATEKIYLSRSSVRSTNTCRNHFLGRFNCVPRKTKRTRVSKFVWISSYFQVWTLLITTNEHDFVRIFLTILLVIVEHSMSNEPIDNERVRLESSIFMAKSVQMSIDDD